MPGPETIGLYGPPILIGLALLWGAGRILFLNRTAGVSVLSVLRRKRSSVETMAGVVAVVYDLYLLARPLWPGLDELVHAAPSPYGVWGVGLMAFGVLIAVISQVDMGKSWRIGLPETLEDDQGLVTGGLYQFSRNPIYVGIMIFLIGGIVLVPGPMPILATILTWIFIGRIIAAEEAFLTQAFGAPYEAYKARVRRWL